MKTELEKRAGGKKRHRRNSSATDTEMTMNHHKPVTGQSSKRKKQKLGRLNQLTSSEELPSEPQIYPLNQTAIPISSRKPLILPQDQALWKAEIIQEMRELNFELSNRLFKRIENMEY